MEEEEEEKESWMSKSQKVRELCVRRLPSFHQHIATDSASSLGANPSPQEHESSIRGWQSASYCPRAQQTHQHALKQTLTAHWTGQ